jgi:hypothetical protein
MIKSYSIVFLIVLPCFAAFEKLEIGAKPLSLGNAMVAWQKNPYALYYNPSNIYISDDFYMGLSYRSFYGLYEVSQVNIISNFTIRNMCLALAVNRFGNTYYQEYQFNMGSAYQLTEEASLGISIQYYLLKIANYGNQGCWGVNMGFQYQVLNELSIGSLVTNINKPIMGSTNEKLPQTLSLGFYYTPVSVLKIGFELYRDVRFSQDYRAGIAYTVTKNLVLCMGLNDQTRSFSLGLGIEIKSIEIDYAVLFHQILGVSYAISCGLTI